MVGHIGSFNGLLRSWKLVYHGIPTLKWWSHRLSPIFQHQTHQRRNILGRMMKMVKDAVCHPVFTTDCYQILSDHQWLFSSALLWGATRPRSVLRYNGRASPKPGAGYADPRMEESRFGMSGCSEASALAVKMKHWIPEIVLVSWMPSDASILTNQY